MNNLALAYFHRVQGVPAENVERAIDCYQQAMQVLRREMMPVEWAQTMSNLAVAYSKRI